MTRAMTWFLFAVLISARASVAVAAEADATPVDQGLYPDFPPHVVKTEPAMNAKDVDFALREIKVTFDRPMQTGQYWSWIMHRNLGVYPGYRGGPEPRWENDGRTCVLPVKLSPDTLYAVGVNSFRHKGFRSPEGKVAVPCVWVFKTKKAE